MTLRTSLALAALVALSTSASLANAQVRPGRGERAQEADAQDRPLARQAREAFGGVVRRQLKLDDEKWKQFQRADRQFEQQRNQLRRDEREARLGLLTAMQDTVNVDQNKIAQYMDQLTQAQRRRADILAAEQKELSGFLTPLQRARLLALREQLTQRVMQAERGQGGRRGGVPQPPPR